GLMEMEVNGNQGNAFSSWKFASLFVFKEEKGKNVTVQCRLCKPVEKLLSTSKNSTSNLKKHLERMHPDTCASYVPKTPCHKRELRDGTSEERPAKLAKLSSSFKTVTQKKVNALVFNFIVADVQAFSVLEQPSFVKLIEGLQPGRSLMSQKALVEKIGWAFQSMKETIAAELMGVHSVCSTADVWTANGRSYFGVTCHWIDDSTLERKSVALACSPLQGRPTCDVLVAKLNEIHSHFNIQVKLQCTVTDNGSSLVKAFQQFAYKEEVPEHRHETVFEDVNEILESDIKELQFLLPPHQRCAANTLGLIASSDVHQALSQGATRGLYRSAMAKCLAIWQKAHNSSLAADFIEEIASMKVVVPSAMRWIHEYRAIQKILSLTDEQLQEACNLLVVESFQAEEMLFLQEYVEVLKPLAYSLDFIQGEKKCFLGYLLPTVLTLKTKLSEIKPYVRFLAHLIDTLIKAIDCKFEKLLGSREAKIATLTIPKFRMWWLPPAEREEAEKMLAEVAAVEEELHGNSDPKAACDSDSESEDNFFNFATTHGEVNNSIESEVRNYLLDTSKCTSCLKKYPAVRHLFIKYNTTLLSCVPVERLYSHGGQILTQRHKGTSDDHFEQVLLLRYNWDSCPFLSA
uniref:Uncharacterized LOC102693305 n=1 Tax=Lepisosteus oculatus TaxID=7918 RepID=W5N607_LEPOC